MRRPSTSSVISFLAVAASAVFVLAQLKPELIVADTHASGGDMGAHVWGPAYLRDHLLPHGRITGWTPDWYAGFAWLTFYFPIPSLLIVGLDVALPYTIAFKLVTVAGVVTLPAAAWAFGRLAGARFPVPAVLAAATVPFLFDRSFTIYGGNIPSTLAGEFAFSISLSLALVLLGLVARGLDTGRHRALAAVLLALTGLTHVIPTFFALGGIAVLTLLRLDRHRLRYTVTLGATGGAMAAFWIVPFLARLAYTNDMGWEKLTDYRKQLLPEDLQWLLVLAAVGIAIALALRDRLGVFLTIMAGASAAAFVLAPQGRLWNARLLPFWFLCLYLLAGYGVGQLPGLVRHLVGSGPQGAHARHARAGGPGVFALATPVAATAAALTYVALPLGALPGWVPLETTDSSFIPFWAKWNYEGYERKADYAEYRNLIDTMDELGESNGCGRAMWEYEPELDRLGTPMALMLLPYWTDGCIGSMEGLFFESSATTPYHFLNQSELSARPSRAQRDLPYRDLDVAAGVEHLQLLGVRYYMAFSPSAVAQAHANPDLELVATSGPWIVKQGAAAGQERLWEIFEVKDSPLVEPLDAEPVVMSGVAKGGEEWLDAAVDWYQDPTRWDVHLAASGPPGWRRVRGADPDPPYTPVGEATVSNIDADDDSISFDVDNPGVPVLVKASYFPNWQAHGAEGPWRVTPNLMVVLPTDTHVELRYGWTPVDLAGWVITLLGAAGAVVLARRPPVAYPVPPAPEEAPSEQDAEAGGGPAGRELVTVTDEA